MSVALMATMVFWTCCALLLYVYLIYPLLVRVLGARFGTPARRGADLPSVTILITAYNEEKSIRDKLLNISRLDYPAELLNTMVVSDASSDATEEIARRFDPAHVTVLRIEGRQGKTACQNAGAAVARGDILVFTDATTRIDPGALRRLVENFADGDVGCVASGPVYVSDVDNATSDGCATYWSYELRLRAAESLLGCLIGVSGCLYAVRRSAYVPIDPGLISDFVVAMKMREQGLRTVLAADAVCFEETLDRGSRELAMRVRVAVRSMHALIHERRFLNPWRYGSLAWALWSHKVLRYASPVLWMAALAANIILLVRHMGWGYWVLLVMQCALILAGVLGFFLQTSRATPGILGRPYYFLLTNLASFIATLRYLKGDRMVTWKPLR
jgi:cellulose synthase/poly-beta-1,6-N-acetylglucosamine synthase-like glycosyltransferase